MSFCIAAQSSPDSVGSGAWCIDHFSSRRISEFLMMTSVPVELQTVVCPGGPFFVTVNASPALNLGGLVGQSIL